MGGTAEVLLAVQHGFGGSERLLAVKRLHRHLHNDPAAERRFVAEARICAALSHPNVVAVLDVCELDGVPSIVMEYLSGESVETIIDEARLTQTPVPVPIAVQIVADIAGALHAAHTLAFDGGGIVHRDLTPANIVITRQGIAKLIDFGMAAPDERSQPGITRYSAPELVRGEPLEPRSDIFSLGTILFELVAGRPVFAAGHPAALGHALLEGAVPQLSSLRPDCPVALEGVVERALSQTPQMRYQTAERFQCALEGVLAGLGVNVSPARIGRWISRAMPARLERRWQIERAAIIQARTDRTDPTERAPRALPDFDAEIRSELLVSPSEEFTVPQALAPAPKGRASLIVAAVVGLGVLLGGAYLLGQMLG